MNKKETPFDDWTKEQLIEFLIGIMNVNNKLMIWLYQNHLDILREYEDKQHHGIHLHLFGEGK